MELENKPLMVGLFVCGLVIGAAVYAVVSGFLVPAQLSKEQAQDMAATAAFRLSAPGAQVMAYQTNESDDFYVIMMQFTWENGANYTAPGYITKDGKYFTDRLWDVRQVLNETA